MPHAVYTMHFDPVDVIDGESSSHHQLVWIAQQQNCKKVQVNALNAKVPARQFRCPLGD